LGLALLIFGIFLSMLYLGSGRILYVIWGVLLFAGGALICYKLFTYVQARVTVVGIDCNSTDPVTRQIILGPAYQICQGLIAIGSGGVFGTGLGLGSPTNVPAVQTDYVFAAVSEEFGLLGVMALLGIYIMLIHRGFRIAANAKTAFNQLLAGGLTAVFAIQTMIIIAGNLKLMPLTGIPLPFITYGGSSLIANYIIIGLLLRISASEST
jgi:cell division protein FtsW (lipid II flippase)